MNRVGKKIPSGRMFPPGFSLLAEVDDDFEVGEVPLDEVLPDLLHCDPFGLHGLRDGNILGELAETVGFRRRLRGRIATWTRLGLDPATQAPRGPSVVDAAEWAIFAHYRQVLRDALLDSHPLVREAVQSALAEFARRETIFATTRETVRLTTAAGESPTGDSQRTVLQSARSTTPLSELVT